eukprot:EG_transcript_17074
MAQALESARTLLGHTVRFPDLQPGDHIYTVNLKGLFTHHGIVVAKGDSEETTEVVEFNVARGTHLPERVAAKQVLQPGIMQQMIEAARIQKITLAQFSTVADVVGPDGLPPTKEVRRVHYNDLGFVVTLARRGAAHAKPCDDAAVVVQRALEKLESQDWPPYSIVTNNCEHFAVWCKTGERYSCQVARVSEKYHESIQDGLDRSVKVMAKFEASIRGKLPTGKVRQSR